MLKDAINLDAIRRVLVIKLRHHGDVLLTSPVFRVLKNHAPHLSIDALVYSETAPMLTLHPQIEQVHTIDRKWKQQSLGNHLKQEWRLLVALRQRKYDLVVHLTEHPRGAWLRQAVGARFGVAPDVKQSVLWRKSFSHFYRLPRGTPRHTVELNLDALRRIGIYPRDDERNLILVPGDEATQSIGALLSQHGLSDKNFIHIHPTSRWLFKCWPVEKVRELIVELQHQNFSVVVTAAPEEREMSMLQQIIAPLAQPVVNLAGQLSLKQLAALTAGAKCFVGVDSAPMHIAAAMQTPTVALFGPSGEYEWGPWRVKHRIVKSNHSCRPCGNDGCGGGKVSECLTTLPVSQVLQAIRELL